MATKRLTEVKKQESRPKDSRFDENPTCSECGVGMVKEGQVFVCPNCGDTSSHS